MQRSLLWKQFSARSPTSIMQQTYRVDYMYLVIVGTICCSVHMQGNTHVCKRKHDSVDMASHLFKKGHAPMCAFYIYIDTVSNKHMVFSTKYQAMVQLQWWYMKMLSIEHTYQVHFSTGMTQRCTAITIEKPDNDYFPTLTVAQKQRKSTPAHHKRVSVHILA